MMNIHSGITWTVYWELVDNLPICPIEEKGYSNILVIWKHYSTKNTLSKKREEKKKLIYFFQILILC
jgi:hypothetical protein